MILDITKKVLESLREYEDFRNWHSSLSDQDQLNLSKRLTRVVKMEIQRLLEG